MCHSSPVSEEIFRVAIGIAIREAWNVFRYRGRYSGKDWYARALNTLMKWIDPRNRDIKIKVFSYTGQTMYEPIFMVLQNKVQRGLLDRNRVEIQILLRDVRYPFLLRDRKKNSDYELYDGEVAKTAENAIQNWRGMVQDLSDNIYIKIRAYRFEPSFKGMIIDGTRGFLGIYNIDLKHRKSTGEKTIVAPDYVARDTNLVKLNNPKCGPGFVLLNSFRSCFKAAWRDEFSRPLD